MDAAAMTGLFTLGGTITGGLFGVIGKIATDYFQAKRDYEVRHEQQRSEFRRWQREQVILLMTNSARAASFYTAKAIGKDQNTRDNNPEIQQASAELQGWLIALASVYPDTSSDEYRQFVEYVDQALWRAVPADEPVWEIRKLLVKLSMRLGIKLLPPEISE